VKNVAIFISGGGSNMIKLAQSLENSDLGRVCVVVSNVPTAGGLAWAEGRGIPTIVVDHKDFPKDRAGFEAEIQAQLAQYAPDVICLAGFMRVLTGEFIAQYEGRMLNIHPSLLPKYKGLHTHQRALDAGDIEAGCTVHLVTAELDDGPILGQSRVAIAPDDTADTLAAKVLVEEHKLYPAVLDRFLEDV
jgi:phosphoribosylglycinamide formyltransferase-1